MKLTMTLLLALLLSANVRAQSDSLLLVFWNCENFFNPGSEGIDASRRWSTRRFDAKCNGIAKIIFRIADEKGRLPDLLALAEVEDISVLRKLLGHTALRKLDYSIIHFDSPDHRGIDCALLYRRSTLPALIYAEPKHVYTADGSVMATRDILLARFDSLAVLVTHQPSKVGDGSGDSRRLAMGRLREVSDSLDCGWIAVGDFNEDIWGDPDKPGTIKYNGKWEKIDGFLSGGGIVCKEEICAFPELLEKDRGFGGLKPRRSYIGPRYNKGISDHLPIAIFLYY